MSCFKFDEEKLNGLLSKDEIALNQDSNSAEEEKIVEVEEKKSVPPDYTTLDHSLKNKKCVPPAASSQQ